MDAQHHDLPTAVQPMDQDELPERVAPVKCLLCEPGAVAVQLIGRSRCWQDVLAKVKAQIEGLVLDEHRLVQPEGHRLDPPSQGWQLIQARGHVKAHIGQVERDR